MKCEDLKAGMLIDIRCKNKVEDWTVGYIIKVCSSTIAFEYRTDENVVKGMVGDINDFEYEEHWCNKFDKVCNYYKQGLAGLSNRMCLLCEIDNNLLAQQPQEEIE